MPVELLERAAVELRGRHVRGDGEERRGIRERDGERHDDVRRAGAAGGERRRRRVAHAKVGVRHVAGDLLVARRDELDAVARVVEAIEHTDVAVPADPEHVRDFVADQVLGDDLGTLHAGHVCTRADLGRELILYESG